MRKTLICLAGLAAAGSSLLPAATIIVRADGGGDFTTISAAVAATAAVPPASDTIQITEAATYANTVTFGTADKIIIIEATVPGVIAIGTGVSGGWVATAAAGAGTLDVTLRDFEIFRDTGTGSCFDVSQSATNPINLTFDNMKLTSQAADPLRLNAGSGAGGAQVTITATDTTFDATNTPAATARAAIRGQGATAIWDNLAVNLTNCQLLGSVNNVGQGIRVDSFSAVGAQTNNVWTLVGCTVTSPLNRGILFDEPLSNFTLDMTDTTVTSAEEAISYSEVAAAANNTFSFNRCTFDNTGGTALDRLCDIRILSGTVESYNSLYLVQEDVGGTLLTRGLHLEGAIDFTVYHNTFVGAGVTGGGRGISLNSWTGVGLYSNNITDNLNDPFGGSSVGVTLTGNMYSVAEGSGGADRIEADPNLDGSYAPQDPSDAMGAGDPSATIATAVGNVDHDGNSRPNPVATNPDIGAFETASVPVEVTTFGLE